MPDEHDTQTISEVPKKVHSKNNLSVPIAIVIAAVLIAGAILYTKDSTIKNPIQVGNEKQNAQITDEIEVIPVTKDDHILGNPNAPIIIVEYSDFDCPFCKNFHETMQKIMTDYGKEGQVAWVYRHFPIEKLHPNSPAVAMASECVAEIGGNDAFWKFIDLIFAERGTNEPTNILKLPDFASEVGVNKDAFKTCIESGKFASVVTDSIAEAVKAGARGTPYSFIIAGDQRATINGAQHYQTVKQMIETILGQIQGRE